MNILYITPMLPYPLHSGGQVRFYHLLKRLSQKHRIHLVTFIRHQSERKYLKDLSFLPRITVFFRGHRLRPDYLFRAATGKYPLLIASYDHRQAGVFVGQEVASGRYDLVHLEPFYVFPVLPPELSLPLVVAEHNVEYRVYEDFARKTVFLPLRAVLAAEARRIGTWEKTVLGRADRVIAVSDSDRQELARLTSKPVDVVPNGVDLAWFGEVSRPEDKYNPDLLFVGNFNWLPNREAAVRIAALPWDRLRHRFPKLTITVAGRNLPVGLQKTLAQKGIVYRDDIADIREAFSAADVFLADMAVAGGSKFKCLEAIASRVPVVATPEAVFGLNLVSGRDYLEIGSASSDLPAALEKLKNKKIRVGLAQNARRHVAAFYDWDKLAVLQDRVWESLA